MSGNTDLGPSGAYMLLSLALLCAAAGATWSVDAVIRPHLGRLAPLAGSVPAAWQQPFLINACSGGTRHAPVRQRFR